MKKALNIDQQIAKLKSHGMEFDNEEKAQEACQKLRESGSCQQVFLTVPFNNYGGKTIDGE